MVQKENHRKRKVLIALCIVAVLILLCPVRYELKDGGTVVYEHMLYSVADRHSSSPEGGYDEGMVIKILGIEVFNNVHNVQ